MVLFRARSSALLKALHVLCQLTVHPARRDHLDVGRDNKEVRKLLSLNFLLCVWACGVVLVIECNCGLLFGVPYAGCVAGEYAVWRECVLYGAS